MKKAPFFLLSLWLLVFALIYLHTTDVFDQDLGRHIKLGEIILATKQVPKINKFAFVPKVNLFSYTNASEPVFNSHWGSQVVFYLIHQVSGVNGLILLSTIINTAAIFLLFLLATKRAGFFLPSLLFIPFSFLLSDRSWIRPEMFGNLFYAILLVTLFLKRVRNKLKWFFPIITLFWINLHISAVFGVFTMAMILLQDTLEQVREIGLIRGIRENGGILLLTLFALLINPYGFDGVMSAFTVLNKYGYTIVENQSWLFLRDFGFPLVGHIFFSFFVLFCSIFMIIFTKRKPLLAEVLILFVISILTLRFVRNETLFAYSAFLTATFNLALLQKRVKHDFALSLFVLFATAFLIGHSHDEKGLPLGFGNKESYKAGVDFFLQHDLKGPIFNNFDIGGYLIYRLYPKEKVFVDNRPEAYPVAFFEDVYKKMQFDETTFAKYTKIYGIQTIVWGRRDITDWSNAFLTTLVKNPVWKPLYADDATVIFTKK